MKKHKSGFTLVELLIVIIIVAILAALAVPMMTGDVERARKTEAVAALSALRTAARLYQAKDNMNRLPFGMSQINGYVNTADLSGRYYQSGDYSIDGDFIIASNANVGSDVSINMIDGTLAGD